MPKLSLTPGEYLTIGDDIAVQVFLDSGSRIRVAVNAPKEMTILRGEVRERNGVQRPEGLVGPEHRKSSGPEGRPEPKPSAAGLARRGEAAE